MRLVSTIAGLALGVLADFVSPWPDIIMKASKTILETPSIANHPGLASLVKVLGVLCAVAVLPLAFGVLGYFASSSGR